LVIDYCLDFACFALEMAGNRTPLDSFWINAAHTPNTRQNIDRENKSSDKEFPA
jgi:hypothetical protein